MILFYFFYFWGLFSCVHLCCNALDSLIHLSISNKACNMEICQRLLKDTIIRGGEIDQVTCTMASNTHISRWHNSIKMCQTVWTVISGSLYLAWQPLAVLGSNKIFLQEMLLDFDDRPPPLCLSELLHFSRTQLGLKSKPHNYFSLFWSMKCIQTKKLTKLGKQKDASMPLCGDVRTKLKLQPI